MTGLHPPRFTHLDADRAYKTWGANCGPGALAAITGLTLDEVRPHLVGFDVKRYTNTLMMYAALRSIRAPFTKGLLWPTHGLVRVQWEGPWTAPGVPMRARARYSHWIAARSLSASDIQIFDINCMSVGGWVALPEWRDAVVPWILRECHPKADGKWHATHVLEVRGPEPATEHA